MNQERGASVRRREFLKGAAGVAGTFGMAGVFQSLMSKRARAAAMIGPGFGLLAPVADDATGLPLILLPEGYSYVTYGWTGDVMSDGNLTPDFYAVNTMQPPYQPSSNPPAEGGDPAYADPSKPTTLPPQTMPNIGDRLSDKGVTWAWYGGAWQAVLDHGNSNPIPTFQFHHQPFNYFANYAPGTRASMLPSWRAWSLQWMRMNSSHSRQFKSPNIGCRQRVSRLADGSAALVVGTARESGAESFRLRATGSCLIPDSRHVMSWKVGDHGFEMRLTAEVADKIIMHLRPWIGEWLAEHGHTIESVQSWAVHPGGPKILSAVEEALTLSPDATRVSHEVLATYGNMSSPTVLFILDRMRREGAPRPCVALGFGPGLYAEAALFE